METEPNTTEPCVEHSQEHCKDSNPASHKEDRLLQLLDHITYTAQQHLDWKTTGGEQEGQLPQSKELLLGQGVTGQSLLRPLEVLRELGHIHTERTQAWRHAVNATAQLYSQWQQAETGNLRTPLTGKQALGRRCEN